MICLIGTIGSNFLLVNKESLTFVVSVIPLDLMAFNESLLIVFLYFNESEILYAAFTFIEIKFINNIKSIKRIYQSLIE